MRVSQFRASNDDLVRCMRFTLAAVREHVPDSALDADVESLATWSTEPGVALIVLRRLKPIVETSRATDAGHYALRMVYLAAQIMHDRRSRPDTPVTVHFENAAASALWHVGYASSKAEGSGRICAATIRAVLAGTETP